MELLVSIATIGVLVALLLPATQSARNAARRIDCSNRLKQIGLAVEYYCSNWRNYPDGGLWRYDLLPYLDLASIHQSRGPVTDNPFSCWNPIEREVISAYLCPSDPLSPTHLGVSGANYVGCYGSGVLDHGYNGIFSILAFHNPPNFPVVPTRPADVIDGLSQTAMASELLRGDGQIDSILRVTYQTPVQFLIGQGQQLEEVCDSIPTPPSAYGWRASLVSGHGTPWYNGSFGYGHYNHMLPPNRPSCLNQTHLPTGVHTAASMHGSGVNVLFADGHLQFVAEVIDRDLWKEMGSRASGDLITAF